MGDGISRDPIAERGGLNLYGFAGNSPLAYFDMLGLLKSGDVLEVKDADRRLGEVRIVSYARMPFNGKMSINEREVGAYLRVEPTIDDCGCGSFKWRQRFSEKEDDNYRAAFPRSGKWKYLDPNANELKDILDVDYSKPKDSEWYSPMDLPPGELDPAWASPGLMDTLGAVRMGVLV